MADILSKAIDAQAKSLREFGYPDVTPAMVRVAHGAWIKGEAPDGIIEMFCQSAFDEHPDLFGKPA
jgi:hypothetical protein